VSRHLLASSRHGYSNGLRSPLYLLCEISQTVWYYAEEPRRALSRHDLLGKFNTMRSMEHPCHIPQTQYEWVHVALCKAVLLVHIGVLTDSRVISCLGGWRDEGSLSGLFEEMC